MTRPEGNIATARPGAAGIVVPCFTPGTSIATPKGERMVDFLKPGDKVITRDNGIQEIRWIGKRVLNGRDMTIARHLKPVLIRAGALGGGLPENDIVVSPNHRFLTNTDRSLVEYSDPEALVAAKHLVNNRGIHVLDTLSTTYIHFMCDRHEIVLAHGCWTESYQPTQRTIDGMGNAQRTELLELFPSLKTKEGVAGFTAARPTTTDPVIRIH